MFNPKNAKDTTLGTLYDKQCKNTNDLGNLNFTFIQSGRDHTRNDFRKFTLPILEVLQKLGIDARFEGRNDLTIDGKKFSGNAETVWKNRVLHHGTLLFSAEKSVH